MKKKQKNQYRSYYQVSWDILRRNYVAMICLFIILVLAVIAICAPFLTPYEPNATKPRDRFQSPNAAHLLGTDLGNILTGSMLIETVFTIDGIGKLMVDAINQRDLPLVQGGVMYIAVVCVVIYLLVDILYAVIDPRIRLGGGAEG